MDNSCYELDGLVIKSNPPRTRKCNRGNVTHEGDNKLAADDNCYLEKLAKHDSVCDELSDSMHKYEFSYMDHPADVVLKGEGATIKEAFQSVGIGLFNYITDLDAICVKHKINIRVAAPNLNLLLFHFLDECLFLYSGHDYFIAKHIVICNEINPLDFDEDAMGNVKMLTVDAIAYGDHYNRNLHSSGTEVKAITMHQLKIELQFNGSTFIYKSGKELMNDVVEQLQLSNREQLELQQCRVYTLVDI